MAKLHDYYRDQVVNELKINSATNLSCKSHESKRLPLNMVVGEALTDKKLLDNAVADLAAISGQNL